MVCPPTQTLGRALLTITVLPAALVPPAQELNDLAGKRGEGAQGLGRASPGGGGDLAQALAEHVCTADVNPHPKPLPHWPSFRES